MVKIIIWIVIIVVAAVGIYYLWSKARIKPSVNPISGPLKTTGEPVFEVRVAGFAFEPQEAKIKAGGAVKWLNYDPTNHIIVSDTGVFNSGQIIPSGQFEFVFPSAGEFSYHCSIHPSMIGKIIVE